MPNVIRTVPKIKTGRNQKIPQKSRYIHTDECTITKVHDTNEMDENFFVTKVITLRDKDLNTFFKKIIEISHIAQLYRYELHHKMNYQSYSEMLCIDNKNYSHINEKFTYFLNEYFLTPLLTQAIRGVYYKHYLRFKLPTNFLWDDNSLVETCISNLEIIKKIEKSINKKIKHQMIFWTLYSLLYTPKENNNLFYTLFEINLDKYSDYVISPCDNTEYKKCATNEVRFIWDYINDYLYITDSYKNWAIINTEKGSPAGLYEPHFYWYRG